MSKRARASHGSTPAVRRIELWQSPIHIRTAHLMLDLRDRRLGAAPSDVDGEPYAFAVVATDRDRTVLAATVGRVRFDEVAVAALDKALAAVAREHGQTSEVFWKLNTVRLVVVTDDQSPFDTARFKTAVAELGCVHRTRGSVDGSIGPRDEEGG